MDSARIVHLDPTQGAHSFPCTWAAVATHSQNLLEEPQSAEYLEAHFSYQKQTAEKH